MDSLPPRALGDAIRALREEKEMSQRVLGDKAGYRSGAAVAISRIENGLLTPSSARLEGIAETLGVTTTQLTGRAKRLIASGEPLDAKVIRVGDELDRRARLLDGARDALTDASDDARARFLAPFRAVASQVGAPNPAESPIAPDSAASDAVLQVELTRYGVERALADAPDVPLPPSSVGDDERPFADALTMGIFAGIASLVGTTATSPSVLERALRAGKPIARNSGVGSSAILAGVGLAAVAAVGAGAALAGLVASTKRSRRDQDELAARLQSVDAELTRSADMLSQLQELIDSATKILEYVAVHAAHALSRWEARIGPEGMAWAALTEEQRLGYRGFVDVAAAQLSVASLDIDGLLAAAGDDFDAGLNAARNVLAESRHLIVAHV